MKKQHLIITGVILAVFVVIIYVLSTKYLLTKKLTTKEADVLQEKLKPLELKKKKGVSLTSSEQTDYTNAMQKLIRAGYFPTFYLSGDDMISGLSYPDYAQSTTTH